MNNRKFPIFFFSTLLFFFVPLLIYATPLGIIVYLEGEVNLQRDGNYLELSGSDMGQKLFEYDLIETAQDGFVEIEISGYSNRGTILRAEKNTAFYLTSNSFGDSSKMNIALISGNLSFKVRKLVGSEELNVQTEYAIMAVRGTDFTVQRTLDGSVLVSCVEGKVTCRDDQEIIRYAVPGSVVEKRPGNALYRVDIDVGYEHLYGEYWKKKREEIFKSGAENFIKAYAIQYDSYLTRFLDAYEKLLAVKNKLEDYNFEENQTQKVPSKLLSVKAETTDEITMMRSILPLFENCFYAVQDLKRYHDNGIGYTTLPNKKTSLEFFNDFSRRNKEIKNKLADVRYCIKLYSNISNTVLPGSFASTDIFDDEFSNF